MNSIIKKILMNNGFPGNRKYLLFLCVLLIIIGMVLFFLIPRDPCNPPPPHTTIVTIPEHWLEYSPGLTDLISHISESEIYGSTYAMQNFSTRQYPSSGNKQAADYLNARLSRIPGLERADQNASGQNVIAILPGIDPSSDKVFVVGAHFDSESSDPEAPGATDNGCGVAIVLELAREMSRHTFNHTIYFAFWNAEEADKEGSRDFVSYAAKNSLDIPLYFNFDSACYDPDNQYSLDIMFDDESRPIAELMTYYNSLYDINLSLTYNRYDCDGDHLSFHQCGYPVVMTHSPLHPPENHTRYDTIALISPNFAKKNAQLGMLVLARAAELQP